MPHVLTLTADEADVLRKGGVILRQCLAHLATLVAPGMQTADLDEEAETFIRDHGAAPAFKGYRDYPATLCTSVNEQCVHGIPGAYALAEGDIISIDCGVLFEGLYTDSCITVGVGRIDDLSRRLIDAATRALERALDVVRAGVHVGDISSTIQQEVESRGFSPVPALTGHGIGRSLHQFPDIPNVGKAGTGAVIPAGAAIAIEPIIAAGKGEVYEAGDGWTLIATDGSRCAHMEHTVLVTEDGCDVIA
ncbi:MAG: methionyl aminopeptidase [Candidatus Peregrinibacteria bacterium Gr01-1014_25]|nr:MAG: methionyl aminopeptidase [Candidatus Peregrinibacteria bacterium Gr01-1014_25]